MTVGIYALYWEEQDLVYVGQSQNIKRRFYEHTNTMLKKVHTNYRVQEAYNSYGLPELVVLQVCELEDCNSLEVWWTKEFNSLNSLNIVEAGNVGYGVNGNASKYTKQQILLVFRLLYNTKLSYKGIASIANVNRYLPAEIFGGYTHLWLKAKYPNSYTRMRANPRSNVSEMSLKYLNRGIILVHDSGVEKLVTNIREFAKDNNLFNTCLGEVIRGKRKSHKGWKLK